MCHECSFRAPTTQTHLTPATHESAHSAIIRSSLHVCLPAQDSSPVRHPRSSHTGDRTCTEHTGLRCLWLWHQFPIPTHYIVQGTSRSSGKPREGDRLSAWSAQSELKVNSGARPAGGDTPAASSNTSSLDRAQGMEACPSQFSDYISSANTSCQEGQTREGCRS